MGTCFRYHGAAPGMSHKDRGSILTVKNAFGCGNVVRKRGKRVLDDRHTIAAGGQFVIDAAPARTVGERTVHQHHVPERSGRREFYRQRERLWQSRRRRAAKRFFVLLVMFDLLWIIR